MAYLNKDVFRCSLFVCTKEGVKMHDGRRRGSGCTRHAGTGSHSSTSKEILLLFALLRVFERMEFACWFY